MNLARHDVAKALQEGLRRALDKNFTLGAEDAAALRGLAEATGEPELRLAVNIFAAPHARLPRKRRQRLDGTGLARRVVDFQPGLGAGFNANNLELVLGRPEGGGDEAGSLHFVSLGLGGQMTLELGRQVQTGVKIFGHVFGPGGESLEPEPALVEVSRDGFNWWTLNGVAGFRSVYANSRNRLDLRSHAAGGDVFLFVHSGLPASASIQFVRVTDMGDAPPAEPGSGKAGFGLDAVYGF